MNNYVPPDQWDRHPYPTPVQFPPLLPQSYNHSYSHNHTHNHNHNYPQHRPYSTPFPLPLPSYASASSSTSEWTRPSTVPSYFPPPLAVTASTAFDPVRSETNGISNERGMEFGLHGRKRMDPHPRVKLEKRRMSHSELSRQVIRTYQSLSSQLPLLPPYLDRKLSSCTPKSTSQTPEMESHPHPHSHSQSQTPSLPGPELQTLIKLAMEGLELIRCWSELDDRGHRDGFDSIRKEKEGLGRMREVDGMNGMEGMRMDERTGERESSFPPPFQTDSPSTGIPNSNPDRATNHANPQPPQPSQTPQLKSFLLPAPPSSTPLVHPPTCTLPQGGNLGTVCLGCSTTETPEWRRGPLGPRTLCNACGLVFAKLVRKRAKEASREKEKEKEKEKHSSERGLQGQTGRGKKISKKRIKGGVID